MSHFQVETPVTGTVWKINFQVGDEVSQSDVIMIMEAMKMEIPVESPTTGKLKELGKRGQCLVHSRAFSGSVRAGSLVK